MDGDNNTTSTTELVYAHNSDIQIDQEQMYILLNKATNEFRELQGKKKVITNR